MFVCCVLFLFSLTYTVCVNGTQIPTLNITLHCFLPFVAKQIYTNIKYIQFISDTQSAFENNWFMGSSHRSKQLVKYAFNETFLTRKLRHLPRSHQQISLFRCRCQSDWFFTCHNWLSSHTIRGIFTYFSTTHFYFPDEWTTKQQQIFIFNCHIRFKHILSWSSIQFSFARAFFYYYITISFLVRNVIFFEYIPNSREWHLEITNQFWKLVTSHGRNHRKWTCQRVSSTN